MSDSNSWWQSFWKQKSSRWLLFLPTGAIVVFIAGIFSVHAYDFVFEVSNRNEVCYGCHIGMDTIVEEYEASVHFQNNLGIQAQCADCHVPKEFYPKLKTKILAPVSYTHLTLPTTSRV